MTSSNIWAKDRASANDYLRMVGFLTNLAFSKSYIADIRIIPLNGNPELSNTTVLSSHLFGQAPSDEAYWQEHPVWWSPPALSDTTLGQKRTVSLVRPIRNMNNFDKLGMLSIGIDGDALAERLREAAVDGGGSLFLLDADGNIVAANADPDAAEQWPVKLRALAGQEAPVGAARFSEMGRAAIATLSCRCPCRSPRGAFMRLFPIRHSAPRTGICSNSRP